MWPIELKTPILDRFKFCSALRSKVEDIDCSQHSLYEIDLEVFSVICYCKLIKNSVVCLFVIFQTSFLCVYSWLFWTCSVDQVDFELTYICLSLPLRADIKGVGHYHLENNPVLNSEIQTHFRCSSINHMRSVVFVSSVCFHYLSLNFV